MSNKSKAIYYFILAILYILYTVVIAKHGVHFTNSIITILIFGLAIYYLLKDKKN